MTVLSAQTIQARVESDYMGSSGFYLGKLEITPFEPKSKQFQGMSYGLSVAGYDIRIGKIDRTQPASGEKFTPNGPRTPAQSFLVKPMDFVLLSSLERIKLPPDIIAFVHDKSTLARKGLALQNTVIEPGWEGYITLELSNHGTEHIRILVGQPIAQLVFHYLDQPTDRPYKGKYQNQPDRPVGPILED